MSFRPTAVGWPTPSAGPGSGVGTSSHFMTSGPPWEWMRIALVIVFSERALSGGAGLEMEQELLGVQPAPARVAAEPGRGHDPVARDEHGNRVGAVRLSDGTGA